MIRNTQSQNGFTLLELLLAITIISLLFSGAAQVFDNWAKDRVNSKVATEMRNIQNAAEGYVAFNFAKILANDISTPGDVFEVDLQDMIDDGFLPNDFDGLNSFRQQMIVMARYREDNPIDGAVFEVITVTEDQNAMDSRMFDGRLFKAATEGGPNIGVVSDLDLGTNCCRGNIQSVYGTWSVDLIDFAAIYNPNPNQDRGGYMAAYGRITSKGQADEPYLYRVSVSGQPELNRMNTNLYMNNNDIENIGVIASDNIEVNGNLALNNTNSPYILSVNNDLNVNGALNVLSTSGEKGDIIIHGDGNNATRDLNISGGLSVQKNNIPASGSITSESVSANTMANTQGNITTNTMSVQGANMNAGNLYAIGMTVGDVITTNTLQSSAASDIETINTGSATVQRLSILGGMSVNGNMDVEDNIGVEGGATLGSVQGTDTIIIENLTCLTPSDCP